MLDKKIIIDRLSIIKYIFSNAEQVFSKPIPLSITSLLMLHDAIELLLHLIIEHYDIGNYNNNKNLTFMKYWEVINNSDIDKEIRFKESMSRLNSARVAFKHHGTMPSDNDLISFQSTSRQFLEETVALFFDIPFSKISLTHLIQNETVREHLQIAEKLIESKEYKKALADVRLSFYYMINKYEENKLIDHFDNVFELINDIQLQDSFTMRFSKSNEFSDDMIRYIDQTNGAIKKLSETIKIIGYGIDYRKYSWFNAITPRVIQYMNGKLEIEENYNTPEITHEHVSFAIEFCVESYLKLIDFDIDIKTHDQLTEEMNQRNKRLKSNNV